MSTVVTVDSLVSLGRIRSSKPTIFTERIHVTEKTQAEEVLAVLDDEYSQAILKRTRGKAMSAKELSEACGISLSTIYRRADRLVNCGLLAERRVVGSDGTHYSMYETRLDELTLSLTEDGFEVGIIERQTGDLADRFTEMWEGL